MDDEIKNMMATMAMLRSALLDLEPIKTKCEVIDFLKYKKERDHGKAFEGRSEDI